MRESSLCFMPTDKVKEAVHKRRPAKDGHRQILGLEVAINPNRFTVSAIELDAVRAGRHRANPLSADGPVHFRISPGNGARPNQCVGVLKQTAEAEMDGVRFSRDLVAQEHEARLGEHERLGDPIRPA